MKKQMIKPVSIPGWVFVAAMVVFDECILHFWTMDTFMPGRFAAVAAFALGFGCLTALIAGIFGPRAEKWLAVVLTAMFAVLYLAEYFMIDAYKTFMSLDTMFGRAGDVAGDYMDTVISLLRQNVWRIGLMLLPVVLFALFGKPKKVGIRTRVALAAVTVAAYLLGFGIVKWVGTDASKLDTAYNFDNAIHSFGLHMGLILEEWKGGSKEAEPTFVVPVETQPASAETTQPGTSETEETAEATEPPVVYGDNAFDLDYAALAEAEPNANIASLHSYVASQTPSKQNEYTGLFAGKNLILITAEAFSAEVIDPERTPTLYRLATEGIQFEEYYQPVWHGSTTTGEFTNLIGLVPLYTGAAMQEVRRQNMFLTMGNQLQELGYSSAAYHNGSYTYYERHTTHELLGYDTYMGIYNGLEEGVLPQNPSSDLEMIEFTLPKHLDQEPFSLYYMTVSGHASYWPTTNSMVVKHYDEVADLPYSEQVKGYLAANMELELALESMVRQLEEAGIADDTVIVIATDHYPYGLEPSDAWGNYENYLNELYGFEVTDCFTRDHSALIIWSGSLEDQEPIVVDTPVYSLDILPTLSNLFGLEFDSRLLVGRDVFADTEPLVLWPTHCWLTDKGSYDISTNIFTPREGVEVEEGYVERIKALVANKITFSKAVQQYTYYTAVQEALGMDTSE